MSCALRPGQRFIRPKRFARKADVSSGLPTRPLLTCCDPARGRSTPVANQTALADRKPLAWSKGIDFKMETRLAGNASHDVGRQIPFGAFEEFELHSFAFIEGAVAVFLDRGKVDENIFAGRSLNEPISLGAVEPLHCTLLSHAELLSPQLRIEFSPAESGRDKRLLLCRPAFPPQRRLPDAARTGSALPIATLRLVPLSSTKTSTRIRS